MLYEAKQNEETNMLKMKKSGIRLCADTAMLIGQTNFEILNVRRTIIMPEQYYSYRKLSFNQGNHPKFLFGDTLPQQIKDISETNKVGFAILRESFTPSGTVSIPPHKFPQNKIQPSFFVRGLDGINRMTSVHAETVAPIPSKLQKTAEPVPIRQQDLQLKSKAEIPAHCDTQVRKIEEYIKMSNKKLKAGNIASCLSKWKEITSNKWVLSTVSGANIELEDITQIPLAQRKRQKHERDSNSFRQEIENLL